MDQMRRLPEMGKHFDTVSLSDKQIEFIAERTGVMSVFQGASVFA